MVLERMSSTKVALPEFIVTDPGEGFGGYLRHDFDRGEIREYCISDDTHAVSYSVFVSPYEKVVDNASLSSIFLRLRCKQLCDADAILGYDYNLQGEPDTYARNQLAIGSEEPFVYQVPWNGQRQWEWGGDSESQRQIIALARAYGHASLVLIRA